MDTVVSMGSFTTAKRCSSFFPRPAAGFNAKCHVAEGLLGRRYGLVLAIGDIDFISPMSWAGYALKARTLVRVDTVSPGYSCKFLNDCPLAWVVEENSSRASRKDDTGFKYHGKLYSVRSLDGYVTPTVQKDAKKPKKQSVNTNGSENINKQESQLMHTPQGPEISAPSQQLPRPQQHTCFPTRTLSNCIPWMGPPVEETGANAEGLKVTEDMKNDSDARATSSLSFPEPSESVSKASCGTECLVAASKPSKVPKKKKLSMKSAKSKIWRYSDNGYWTITYPLAPKDNDILLAGDVKWRVGDCLRVLKEKEGVSFHPTIDLAGKIGLIKNIAYDATEVDGNPADMLEVYIYEAGFNIYVPAPYATPVYSDKKFLSWTALKLILSKVHLIFCSQCLPVLLLKLLICPFHTESAEKRTCSADRGTIFSLFQTRMRYR